MLGFPAYYFIWEYWFPQSYENLGLRCAAAVLFGGLVFRDSMPKKWQRVYAGLFFIHHRFLLTLFLRFYDVNE